MELTTPEQKPIPIHDYEFTFLGKPDLVISIFPTMGDTVERKDRDFWVFNFPRLHVEQEVFGGPNLLTFRKQEHMRLYVDPNEVARKIIEERKRLKAEKEQKEQETPDGEEASQ
jgi:hypothetical protein